MPQLPEKYCCSRSTPNLWKNGENICLILVQLR
jgi:hypothetical protein